MPISKEQQEMMQWMRDDPHGFSAKMKERYPTATEEQISGLFTKVGMKPPTPVVQLPEIPIQPAAATLGKGAYTRPSGTVVLPTQQIRGQLPPGYSKDAAGNLVYTHPPIPVTGAAPSVGTVKSGSVPTPKGTDDAVLTEGMRK